MLTKARRTPPSTSSTTSPTCMWVRGSGTCTWTASSTLWRSGILFAGSFRFAARQGHFGRAGPLAELRRDDGGVRRYPGQGQLSRFKQAHRAAGADDLLLDLPDEFHGPGAGGPVARGRGHHGDRVHEGRADHRSQHHLRHVDHGLPAHDLLQHQDQGHRRICQGIVFSPVRQVDAAVQLPPETGGGVGQAGITGAAAVRESLRRRADLHSDRPVHAFRGRTHGDRIAVERLFARHDRHTCSSR